MFHEVELTSVVWKPHHKFNSLPKDNKSNVIHNHKFNSLSKDNKSNVIHISVYPPRILKEIGIINCVIDSWNHPWNPIPILHCSCHLCTHIDNLIKPISQNGSNVKTMSFHAMDDTCLYSVNGPWGDYSQKIHCICIGCNVICFSL